MKPFFYVMISVVCILVASIVVISFSINLPFLYTYFLHDDITPDKLAQLGQIGDFFSGHLNGFVLIILAITLLLQHKSIYQVEQSLIMQKEANIASDDNVKKQLEIYNEQNRQLMISNFDSKCYKEKEHILRYETDLELDRIIKNRFQYFIQIDHYKLTDFLSKIEDMQHIIQDYNTQVPRIKRELTEYLGEYYNDNNIMMLKKVIITIKLFHLYENYFLFINMLKHETQYINMVNPLNLKYLFLKKYMKDNGIELHEDIVNLFIKFDIPNDNKEKQEELLWNSIKQLKNVEAYYKAIRSLL